MIPIKGYATFDPLKHCWLGSGFKAEWFHDLPIYKNDKIMDPLKKIADETEEDYQTLEKLLKDAGVKTYRHFLDMKNSKSLNNTWTPPTEPRDAMAVVGEKLYADITNVAYNDILQQIDRKDIEIVKNPVEQINTATICRVGKDFWWDVNVQNKNSEQIRHYRNTWESQGFRVHISHRGYHSDAVFCVVKPGCIVSLRNIQDYKKEFPGWDVLYLSEQSWDKVHPFLEMKNKVGGRWWLKGEEHNDQLIEFVNTWLDDWVGYVEETVFDANMLSIDQNTIICNNYNKDVFNHFKKHKVEPIIFNFRHRYFWDGGVHCITQDLYREGTQEDYFG